MKKSLLILAAVFSYLMPIHATNNVAVNNVTIPQGGTGTISVALNNDKSYTAFSMKLTLPEGVTYTGVNKGTRMAEDHSVSGNGTTGVITCLSISNATFTGTSGTLFTITVSVSNEAVVGSSLGATLTEINFSTTSAEEPFDNVGFNIIVGEPDDGRIHFDENSETLPTYTAGESGDVSMVRSIKKDEWSTIVLPFTLTKTKAYAVFGEDVQLMEFTGFEVDYGDDDENVIPLGISIKVTAYTLSNQKPMKGGKPYLIKTSKDITNIEADNCTLVGTVTDVVKQDELETSGRMTGTFVKTTIPEDGLFLSGNKFYYSPGSTSVKAFRCWFDLDAVLDKETNFGSRINLVIEDSETTGISDAARLNNNGKTINENYYGLDGRKLTKQPTKKGVYVRGGKKIVIK